MTTDEVQSKIIEVLWKSYPGDEVAMAALEAELAGLP